MSTPSPRRGWRRTLFDLHGALGLLAGGLLAFIALSGSLAVFRREIDWLTTPALRVAPAAASVSLDAVYAGAARAHPARPGEWLWSIQRPEGPRYAYSVLFRAGDAITEVFVDPATGRATGERDVGIHRGAVANAVRQLHVRLLLGVWGRAFVGLCGVLLVLMALTGLALSRRDRGAVAEGRRAVARRHTRIGWWTLAFHLLSGASGAVLGLEVVPRLARRALRPSPARVVEAPFTPAAPPRPGAVAHAARAAERALPGLSPSILRFDPESLRVTVYLDHPSPWIARGASEVSVDLRDGDVLHVGDARRSSLASRAYDALDPLHFGYFGESWGTLVGYAVRALWYAAGLTPTALLWTGLSLWRRRARGSTNAVRRHARDPLETSAPDAPTTC